MRSKLYRPDLQILINDICMLLLSLRWLPRFEHIAGKENITADALSRYFMDPLEEAFQDSERFECKKHIQRTSDLCSDIVPKDKYLKFEDDDI